MPDPLPAGEILQDNAKKRWKLGTPIGKGGFGEIYSASEEGSKSNKYVIKIVSPFKLTSLFCCHLIINLMSLCKFHC